MKSLAVLEEAESPFVLQIVLAMQAEIQSITNMSSESDQDDLARIKQSNEIALARAKRMVVFLRCVYEKEAQVLNEAEKIAAESGIKLPQDSN